MLGTIVDVENDCYLRIEAVDAQRREVWFSVKNQPVSAVCHGAIDKKEWFDAPVGISPCMAQLGPALVSVLHFEADRDTACGRTSGRVEYVR